jgi:hypothetical protein
VALQHVKPKLVSRIVVSNSDLRSRLLFQRSREAIDIVYMHCETSVWLKMLFRSHKGCKHGLLTWQMVQRKIRSNDEMKCPWHRERRHVSCDQLYSARPAVLEAVAAQFDDPKHGLSDVDTGNAVPVFAQFEAQPTSAATKFEDPARVDLKQRKVEAASPSQPGSSFANKSWKIALRAPSA